MSDCYDYEECMPLEERERRQTLQIMKMLDAGLQRSSRIRKMFTELKLDYSDIKTLSDFEKLPVTSREKLIELEMSEPPYGGLNNTDADVDRIFISPGPVYEPHLSESDHLWARAYYAAGIGKGDVVLNAFSYHMVAAGLTFHGGLRNVGATVIPSGTSSSQLQVELIRDLAVTAYTGTPSFLMAIISKAEEMGYNFKKDFKVRRACFAAEPLAPSLREKFEREYAIDTYQMYGATEVGDVSFECKEKKGWHVCEEVLVEIVDPATGKKVPPGMLGEVVVTRFNNTFFLFRFGTGDLSRLIASPCMCGRTSFRLDGIAGRVGDAVKVRGLFVAPSQLNKIKENFDGIKFQLLIGRVAHEDILIIKLELKEAVLDTKSLEEDLKRFFKEICTVRIDRLEFLKPGSLKDDDRLIVDQREWK
ncbi:MAG TPA: AMP-binding protein [Syntrophales bacterium]|nr:AMP-binding protein [Syntrophales bacterium]